MLIRMFRHKLARICARLLNRLEDNLDFPDELGKLIQQAYRESLAHGGSGQISSLDMLVVCLERLEREESRAFSNIGVLPDDVRGYSKPKREAAIHGGRFHKDAVPTLAVSRIVVGPQETPSSVTNKVFSVLMLDPNVQKCMEAFNRSPLDILTRPTGLI